MKKNTQLFDLIQAMTKGEKRYFKLIASVEGKEKAYVQLFDAIDKQNKYDEKALKKEFSKASFIKHFAVVKNYLFNIILKTLRIYHNDKTPLDNIINMQKNVEILRTKGLVDMALNQLDKAIKQTEDRGFLREKLLLLHWRDNFTAGGYYVDKTQEQIDKELSEKTEVCKQMLNYYEYVELSARIDYLIMRKGIRSEERLDKLKVLFENSLLEKAVPLSWRASIYYHHARSSYFLAQKNYEAYIQEIENNVKLFEDNIALLESEPLTYLIIYNNFISACLYQPSYDFLDKQAQKYQQILREYAKKKNIKYNIEKGLFYSTYTVYIAFYVRNKKFDKAVGKVEESLKDFSKVKAKIPEYLILNYYYQVAYAYFGLKQFEKAQSYLIILLNECDPTKREIIYTSTQLLNLLTHYELGNYEYLEAQTKNMRLYFSRKNLYYAFEKSTIQLIRDLMKAKKEASKKKVVEKHKSHFEILKKDFLQQDAFDYLDILYWMKQFE